MDRKSLFGLIGVSPRHSNRPSLAVLLKRMKRLVLDPDTLEKKYSQELYEVTEHVKTPKSLLQSCFNTDLFRISLLSYVR